LAHSVRHAWWANLVLPAIGASPVGREPSRRLPASLLSDNPLAPVHWKPSRKTAEKSAGGHDKRVMTVVGRGDCWRLLKFSAGRGFGTNASVSLIRSRRLRLVVFEPVAVSVLRILRVVWGLPNPGDGAGPPGPGFPLGDHLLDALLLVCCAVMQLGAVAVDVVQLPRPRWVFGD